MKKSIEDLAREERLKYFKEWRAKNKEKVKANNMRYWEKKAREKLEKEEGAKEWMMFSRFQKCLLLIK